RLAPLVRQAAHTEIVLAPPFTALSVASVPAGRRFAFAAQNLHWEDAGAFTGEVSARMLVALGCTYVIVGHSERRRLCGEDDSVINKKILAATGHGLRPILCIGESPAERRQGQTTRVVTRQLQKGLRGITSQDARLLTIAYEPVWAIGTGIAASPEHIHAVHLTIRACLVKKWGARVANRMRILYGGSVNPDNVVAFVQSPEVDGVLVGGACLDPRTFAKIVRRC
ncbi:MAG: triose-phosphate isomerase, partial [Nitrospira sp.]